jgi:hypothetical protein
MHSLPPLLASMVGLLVGLWLLVIPGAGFLVLAAHLLAQLVRTRRDHRYPQQAAVRERTRQARRLRPSGPCSRRPSAWAIGISGPASTASQPASSRLTTRA